VFEQPAHISAIRDTMNAIFNDWLPSSGCAVANAALLERYDERFEAETGNGGFEIWIPLMK
jgi:AraC family transcriptional regulator